MLGRPGLARRPVVVQPVVANAAKPEFALHAANLRIDDRLDELREKSVEAPQGAAQVDANAFSVRLGEPVLVRTPRNQIRPIIIIVDEIVDEIAMLFFAAK